MRRNRSFDETVAPGCRGEDLLGALPDAILQHVLSFLPSREAVHTCLLARRWRHQWKSAPALRITGVDSFKSAGHLNEFVNYLIVLRDRAPLHACEIETYQYHEDGGDRDERSRYTDLWIRYALSCHAQLLRLSDHDPANLDPEHEHVENVELNTPIASRHLTTLELDGLLLDEELDFSACPNLHTLKMNRCSLLAILSSPSARHLSITDYDFGGYQEKRALISVPSLVYLEMAGGQGLVPAFETMPSLLTASIKLDHGSNHWDNNDGSLLLGLLSDTTNLELIAKRKMFAAFRKDLKWCTTFSKLKTLSLNDWCVEPDFGPLIYFLQRSPSLEKLCLQLSKPYQHAQETDGSYDSTEPVVALHNLRAVEIKCEAKDERVYKILKVLSLYGVLVQQINIKEKNRSSHRSYSDSEQSNYSRSDSDSEQTEQSNYSHSDSDSEQTEQSNYSHSDSDSEQTEQSNYSHSDSDSKETEQSNYSHSYSDSEQSD